ncbi:MAG: hypothetical protein ACRC1T_05485 [Clostridium chrysemydis]|uniref:hypothetical protein n=1 Tax=Clostridium chrysemydis TaxID=2665504 RepID=UPI003F30BF9E
MKVKELIEELQKLDQDREIYYLGYDNNEDAYANWIIRVTSIKEHNKNNFIDRIEEDGEYQKINKEDYIIL